MGRGEGRVMRWRGVKDEDDVMIRKRNVGKEMRKKRYQDVKENNLVLLMGML
jgi:hypothetical protein